MAAQSKFAALVVKISGSGTIPIIADGAMRRVPAGKAIKVSPAEKAYLDRNNVSYTSKDK